jgi:hypothetical protein
LELRLGLVPISPTQPTVSPLQERYVAPSQQFSPGRPWALLLWALLLWALLLWALLLWALLLWALMLWSPQVLVLESAQRPLLRLWLALLAWSAVGRKALAQQQQKLFSQQQPQVSTQKPWF